MVGAEKDLYIVSSYLLLALDCLGMSAFDPYQTVFSPTAISLEMSV